MKHLGFSLITILLAMASAVAQNPRAQADDSSLARGKRLFENQCGRCHGIKGAGGTGPSLKRPVLRHAANDDALFAVIQGGIPGTGMPETWQMSEREIRQVVAYVRSLGQQTVSSVAGEPRKGKAIYDKGDCVTCHIVGGKGSSLGPDLSDVGTRRGPEYLQKAVLHPGVDMALDPDGYITFLVVLVTTRDGVEIRGGRVNEDTFTIQVRDADGNYHSFYKADLKELHREEGKSLMPSYDNVFSKIEMDNLVAYLASLRGER